METNQTVSQRYSKELEEIEAQIELVKEGDIPVFQLVSTIKGLIINAFYEGKNEGIQQMHDIFRP